MRKRLVIIFAVCLGFLRGFSQDETFVFSHLTEADGLADNVVNCIIKDKLGFLWIGTYNGFNRFDGKNFYSYKIRKGNNTMLNEVVHSLCEDRNGKIWGATNSEVFSYDLQQDKFANYECKSMGRVTGFTNVLCDRMGNVWATGSRTLYKYNTRTNVFDAMVNTLAAQDTLNMHIITKNGLIEDPVKNGFWMTTDSGLIYYDVSANKLLNARSKFNNPLFAKRDVAALCRSAKGNCWFFDNDKKNIVQFDPGTQQEIRQINILDAMPDADGGTIFEDNNDRIWFSSWNYKMLVVDMAKNNRIQRLYHRPEDSRSIAGDFFWTVFQDANSTIWLGTVAGISRCNPEKDIYREYRISSNIPELKNTAIRLAVEDKQDHSFWIISQSAYLIHYYPVSGKYQLFELAKAVKNKEGQLPGYVYSVKFLDDKILVVTSTGSWQLQKSETQLKPFNVLPPGYEDFFCKEIAFDGDSVIYYNSTAKVIYWNRTTNTIKEIYNNSGHPEKIVYGLHVTPNHELWGVTSDSLIAQFTSSGIKTVSIIKDKRRETGTIMSLRSDRAGNLWILNKGAGLYKYNATKKTTQFWNQTDGLPGNRLHSIATDSAGRLWTMLYDKVSVYIPLANKFYNFKIPYSESNLGYYNHLSKLSNGHILGTIYNEIIEFYPERLLASPVLQKPLISQLSVNGKEFSIAGNTAILLKADENTVRLKFGSTLDKEVFPYDLEYRLGEAEANWSIAGENAEAVYNNLSSGKYDFHVRVVGKNNGWQSEEAILVFTIETPFYRTAWFFTGILIFIAAGLYLFYRFRIRQKEKLLMLESKTQMLEKEKALVMYENLKQHLNPHFLFNSLTSLSSLIRIDQHMAGDFLDKMSKVYRYILKNRDNEVVPISEELKFVQLYIDLQKTRFENGLQVQVNIDENYHHRKIAPVTLQNLVENAIKHNTADADSPLIIELFIQDDFLVVRNNLQKKNFVETSNRQGLSNMLSLYRYLSSRPMEIMEDATYFIVKIPLL